MLGEELKRGREELSEVEERSREKEREAEDMEEKVSRSCVC